MHSLPVDSGKALWRSAVLRTEPPASMVPSEGTVTVLSEGTVTVLSGRTVTVLSGGTVCEATALYFPANDYVQWRGD